MHKQFGFTVVEVALVIMVIGVLLVVGVVSMRSFQTSSRDKEREVDVTAFANHLERIYAQPIEPSGSLKGKPAGVYPPIASSSDPSGYFDRMLDGLDEKSLDYPGGTGLVFPDAQSSGADCTTYHSCFNKTTPTTNTSNPNSLDPSKFIYFPMTKDGRVCSTTARDTVLDSSGMVGLCRSFVIYYVLEASPNQVKTIKSKHR